MTSRVSGVFGTELDYVEIAHHSGGFTGTANVWENEDLTDQLDEDGRVVDYAIGSYNNYTTAATHGLRRDDFAYERKLLISAPDSTQTFDLSMVTNTDTTGIIEHISSTDPNYNTLMMGYFKPGSSKAQTLHERLFVSSDETSEYEDFETGDVVSPFTEWTGNGGSITYHADYAKNGSYGVKLSTTTTQYAQAAIVGTVPTLTKNVWVEFWMNQRDAMGSSNVYQLIQFRDVDNDDTQMLQFYNDGGTYRLRSRWQTHGGGNYYSFSSDSEFTLETWHQVKVHLVHSQYGGRMEIWVDGVKDDAMTHEFVDTAGTGTTGYEDIWVGITNYNESGNPIDLWIDDIRVWTGESEWSVEGAGDTAEAIRGHILKEVVTLVEDFTESYEPGFEAYEEVLSDYIALMGGMPNDPYVAYEDDETEWHVQTWVTTGGSIEAATITEAEDTDIKYSGTSSLKVTSPDAGTYLHLVPFWQPVTPIDISGYTHFSIWVYGTNSGRGIIPYIYSGMAGGDDFRWYAMVSDSYAGWQKFEWELGSGYDSIHGTKFEHTDIRRISFPITSAQPGDVFYFDKLEFYSKGVLLKDVGKELLNIANIERPHVVIADEDWSDWVFNNWNVGSYEIAMSVSTEQSYSGKTSIKGTSSAGSYNRASIYKRHVSEDFSYMTDFSFYVYGQNTSDPMDFWITDESGNNRRYQWSDNFSGWKYIEFNINDYNEGVNPESVDFTDINDLSFRWTLGGEDYYFDKLVLYSALGMTKDWTALKELYDPIAVARWVLQQTEELSGWDAPEGVLSTNTDSKVGKYSLKNIDTGPPNASWRNIIRSSVFSPSRDFSPYTGIRFWIKSDHDSSHFGTGSYVTILGPSTWDKVWRIPEWGFSADTWTEIFLPYTAKDPGYDEDITQITRFNIVMRTPDAGAETYTIQIDDVTTYGAMSKDFTVLRTLQELGAAGANLTDSVTKDWTISRELINKIRLMTATDEINIYNDNEAMLSMAVWTSTGGSIDNTAATSEELSTVKVGTSSLKAEHTGGAGTYRHLVPVWYATVNPDITAATHFGLWIYGTNSGKNIQVYLYSNPNLYRQLNTTTEDYAGWKYYEWNIETEWVNDIGFDKGDLDRVAVLFQDVDVGQTYYLDHMSFYSRTSLIVDVSKQLLNISNLAATITKVGTYIEVFSELGAAGANLTDTVTKIGTYVKALSELGASGANLTDTYGYVRGAIYRTLSNAVSLALSV